MSGEMFNPPARIRRMKQHMSPLRLIVDALPGIKSPTAYLKTYFIIFEHFFYS